MPRALAAVGRRGWSVVGFGGVLGELAVADHVTASKLTWTTVSPGPRPRLRSSGGGQLSLCRSAAVSLLMWPAPMPVTVAGNGPAGHLVIGAAPSARAGAELQAGSGIPSTTLARLLLAAEASGSDAGLPRGGVVVVDEAGMAGTRTLHRLLTPAGRDGTKVVLVGDPAQLPPMEAGGALKALAARLGAPELTDNRRQIEPWERQALVDVREDRAGPALAVYRVHGRLVMADTAPDAHGAMVAD